MGWPTVAHSTVVALMIRVRRMLPVGLVVIALAGTESPSTLLPAADVAKPDAKLVEHFERRVRPLLVEHCVTCHGPSKQKASLRLDSAEGLFKGGESGPVVVPGEPDKSRIIQAVRRVDGLEMPPDQKLDDRRIAALVAWVKQGAVWPGYQGGTPARESGQTFTPEQKSYWAFQPVRDWALPVVQKTGWPSSPIDCFILARLEQNHLGPTPPADKRTWLRRVSFGLCGLPPIVEEIDAFARDESPDAHAKVVDRLLASPHYGERWGRHWLDVVRYSDTTGQEADWIMRYAWRYRDYVIHAFNIDKPYDRFVVEQLAGDLLPTLDDPEEYLQQVVAPGFLMLSPKETAEADKERMILDIVDEQIDATGRAFMGLTIACARCHDHKFDPIPTLDYYSLAGVFRSTRTMVDRESTSMWSEYELPPVPSAEQRQQHDTLAGRIDNLQQQLTERRGQVNADQVAWEQQLVAAVSDPAQTPDRAAIREIRGIPPQRRNTRQQHALEVAILADPKTVVRAPDEITGLHAWYQVNSLALADGDEVTSWIDESLNTYDLGAAPEPTTRPKYTSTGFNGGPSVNYSRVADELRTAGEIGLTGDLSYTVFLAAEFHLPDSPQPPNQFAWHIGRIDGPGSVQCLELDSTQVKHRLDIASGSSRDAETTSLTQNVPLIVSVRKEAGERIDTTSIRVGGVDQAVTGSKRGIDVREGPLMVGLGSPGFTPLMDVAELIMFNRVLSDEEENAVGLYLSEKYALQTAYAASPVGLVSTAPENRTHQEQQSLRDYYARTHDGPYRTLSAQQTRLRRQLKALTNSQVLTMVMAPTDEAEPSDLPVYLRGDYNHPGRPAPRRFLQIIAGEDQAPIRTKGSGRLELARWIADARHPLTARVMVNRIWQGHFGNGLVRTSDNFGVLGGKPSHPELLDWLAARFVESGWSIKAMQRLIILSGTARQASRGSAAAGVDPDNRLLSRMPRRRLEVEPIRDAMLAASDQLDRTVGGEIVGWWKEAQTVIDEKRGLIAFAELATDITAYESARRSVYLPVSRNQLYEMFVLFDYADASSVLPKREETTVAPQALFMLNNTLVRRRAKQFAESLLAVLHATDQERMRLAHLKAFARSPTDVELNEGIKFLNGYIEAEAGSGHSREESRYSAWQSYCQLLFCENEFVYVD